MPHPFARRFVLLPAILLGVLAATGAADEKPQQLRPAADDVEVSRDAVLAKGEWSVRDENGNGVLRITKDGVTLDLAKAALIGAGDGVAPDRYEGVGILVENARGVTIKNGVVRGYKVAIRAVNAPGLVLRNVDASECFRQRLGSTPAREEPSDWLWPHENDKNEWETKYGAAFSLTECDGAEVSACRANDGQNGLLLTRCDRCRVFENDFSFNSGWGIALYRSNQCQVARNRCDWCVRGYSHGVYHRGQDSAGILVFEQCSRNLFVGNSATHSGDGFFLYAGHETTQRTGKGGCNENGVYDNDFSHAVANGIEATFSLDNQFVRNNCGDCDHGIWAGYSARSLFAGNKIEDCTTAGISIEHGQENQIVQNQIVGGRAGVHLWWDHDKAFVDGVFGKNRNTSSSKNLIHGNDILGAEVAVRLVRDTGTLLRWNVLNGKKALLVLGAGTKPGEVSNNQFRGTRFRNRDAPEAVINDSGASWALPGKNVRRGRLAGSGPLDPSALAEVRVMVRPPGRLPETPAAPGTLPAALPQGMPRGRKEIRIGEWGPLDPRLPHVLPQRQVAAGRETTIHLSGKGDFKLARVEGEVQVEPTKGKLPATIRVGVLPPSGKRLAGATVPFRLAFDLGGRSRSTSGHLLYAEWDIQFFEWSEDPRKDASAFETLVKEAPAKALRLPKLQFRWQGGGPEGVRNDRFATVATTTIELAAGRYRLRTVSDDGIRVFVDGKKVIDNWTHHAPTEDTADLTLRAGTHAIRVEHFEIDGWAHLELTLEPLP